MRNFFNYFLLISLLTLTINLTYAQTSLTAGDIAIIGYDFDDPDVERFE